MSELHVEDRGAVRTITLNRPASRNGLTYEIALQIVHAISGATSSASGAPSATPSAETKFCSECGKSIARNSKFCAECGAKQG